MYEQIETGKLAKGNGAFVAFIAKNATPYVNRYEEWGEIALSEVTLMLMTHRADNSLGFFGGKVEGNETLLEAAIREVEEEVGHVMTPSQIIDTKLVCSHKISDKFHSHLFVCEVPIADLYGIQQTFFTATHARCESAGASVCHIHENSIDNLLDSSLAKTVREEIEFLLENNII